MSSVAHFIDTDAFIKRLTASGMPESQAEAVTDMVREAREADFTNLVTKSDLAETKADILKWMIGMIGGAVVINAVTVIGAMPALVKMVSH
jgi:hypothetical protein